MQEPGDGTGKARRESWYDFQASGGRSVSKSHANERHSHSTHEGREEHAKRKRHIPVTPHEDRVGRAVEVTAPRADAEVVNGADHVVEAHEVGAPEETEDERTKERADETLDCLLGRQLDEGGATNRDTPDVGEDIVTDDEGCGNPEPNETLEDVIHNEVAKGGC